MPMPMLSIRSSSMDAPPSVVSVSYLPRPGKEDGDFSGATASSISTFAVLSLFLDGTM